MKRALEQPVGRGVDVGRGTADAVDDAVAVGGVDDDAAEVAVIVNVGAAVGVVVEVDVGVDPVDSVAVEEGDDDVAMLTMTE